MLELASLFSDGMVLQQEAWCPVWGWSEPGDRVTVEWLPGAGTGQRPWAATVEADAAGRWTATVEPLGGSSIPSRMRVASARSGEERWVSDVRVGEVWLCSGQSNMQMALGDCLEAEREVREASHPMIRLFSVPCTVPLTPPRDVASRWAVCTPGSASGFSAAGYFFGRDIQRRLNVPVGLISNAWGGTRVEAWMSREALLGDEAGRREVEEYERRLAGQEAGEAARERAEYLADPIGYQRAHAAQDPGNRGEEEGWAAVAFDDFAWPTMEIPGIWQARGVPHSGVLWFRRPVEIPADWAGRELELRLGICDKHDTTYFNGERVGATGWETPNPWTVQRVYRVPGRLVRSGWNLLSVRVYSYRNGGGLAGPKAIMRLAPADGQAEPRAVSLAGGWRYRVEHDFGVTDCLAGQPDALPNQNSPAALYTSMLSPLIPYALRGSLWYQGESNVGDAPGYRRRFPAMIRAWRQAWGGPLPFLFVQLANHHPVEAEPGESPWAELREAQTAALSEPATATAVAVDLGEAEDIHPKNKQEVGRRLALAARACVYGEAVVHSGPTYRSMAIEGGAIRVSFDNVGGGLAAAGGGSLKGFAIAGAEGHWVWAGAEIEGTTVWVTSPAVHAPVAVRYAWADNPDGNLGNCEGLPAAPFRTDGPGTQRDADS